MAQCFIGLDMGTTTVTGALVDVAQSAIQRLAQRRNDAAIEPALATRAEQDPHRLRSLALEVLAELATGPSVVGIVLTGQKHGLLCARRDGKPLTPLITWQDQRTAEPLDDGSTTLRQLHARLADLDWPQNGCRIAHGYGVATLFWLVQHERLPAATRHVCTIADWLAAQLVGGEPVTDPTLAASWGAYDLIKGAWNSGFLARLGLDMRLFPAVRPSGDPLGGLEPRVARQIGLPPGLPVFNAVGDTQASFLGSVADPPRAMLFNLGTGGQICWMVPEFEPPTAAVETRPLPHERYLRVGASLCGGAAYAWLNRTVRVWLAEFGVQASEQAVYERLNALARECDDTEGLRVRPTFLGVRGDPAVQGDPSSVAGSIEGITLDNMSLGALARATLVGIVDELADLYRAHGGDTSRRTQLLATGGGVRHNALLPCLIEERYGLPVQAPREQEAAALGAALLASGRLAPAG